MCAKKGFGQSPTIGAGEAVRNTPSGTHVHTPWPQPPLPHVPADKCHRSACLTLAHPGTLVCPQTRGEIAATQSGGQIFF